MREIKFRAWDKEGCAMADNLYEKWLSPTISEYDRYKYRDFWNIGEIGINTLLWNNKDYELMQYTWLKDKDGKEIYEGDIFWVLWWNNEEEDEYELHWTVVFDDEIGQMTVQLSNWWWDYLYWYLSFNSTWSKRIIWNIYENSYLIK